MTRLRSLGLAAFALAAGCASPAQRTEPATPAAAPSGTAADAPRLVVMIVVDQFREPYLDRYGDLFTGGFRRLLDQGRTYVDASHDHAITETAVGHATLVTGVYPMRHGIVANDWAERTKKGWVDVSNVGDSTVRIVGVPRQMGVSPHSLMRTGLADWLVAANPRSKIASVSRKDRGAVLPAAHVKGQVYWFSGGRFVTSTYYRARYPEWANDFTSRVQPKYLRDSVWENQTPAAALARSTPDSEPYEGDRVHTAFPHRFADEGKPGRFWDWLAGTPMLDALTLDFAETMVQSLELGRDDAPDFLNVSLSQTDAIGHAYGPLSREQLDNLLRLDRELGEFFTFLDRTVGAGQWVVALSADHGALSAPETLPQPGEPAKGHRATEEDRSALTAILSDEAGGTEGARSPDAIAAALKRLPVVADAYTHEQLLRGALADSFAVLERRSLYPGRAASEGSKFGVEIRYVPGFLFAVTGSGHGTPYWYDRHVPMMFMGPGIAAGRDSTRASTTDFAPTLARILGVKTPGDLDGRPLVGVTRR